MKFYVALFLSMIMFIGGCSLRWWKRTQPPPQELQAVMKQAQENLDAVKQLQVYEVYFQDFHEAQKELVNAKNYLQQDHYEQALSSAQKSLAASQRILRQFYQDTIVPSAQEAKVKIEAITDEDPDNPLQEFLPKLSEILDYSEEIENGQQEVDVLKLLEDLDKVTKIGRNTQKTMRQTLESDVSFASGKYELTDQGKQILEAYCQDIMAGKEEFSKLYPNRRIIIKIKVFGYTDRVNFREGTNLIKKLIEEAKKEVPQHDPERRQFLNQRLSEFRAKTISNYIAQFLTQHDSQIHIEQESLGLGEEIPPGISSPYPVADPRRRICKIYSYVLVR